MRKCPQCNAEYGDEIVFCLNDGTKLFDAETVIAGGEDDDEPETIIRTKPIIVDFGNNQTITEAKTEILTTGEVVEEIPATQTSPQVVIIEKKASHKMMYALLLIIGLLLGGLAVLAALYFSKSSNETANTTNINVSVKRNGEAVSKPTPIEKPSIQQIETTAGEVHKEKSSAGDADFNGRVITLNAYVRSAPSKNAAETDVLPMNDRITINERENPNSPWYKVTCEHGITGWMHGDTIEYTR